MPSSSIGLGQWSLKPLRWVRFPYWVYGIDNLLSKEVSAVQIGYENRKEEVVLMADLRVV